MQTTAVAYELLTNPRIIEDFGNLFYDESEGQVRARKRSVATLLLEITSGSKLYLG
jgi:hypothetical protein